MDSLTDPGDSTMTSAKTNNYRNTALASIFGAIFFLYIGIFAGIDLSPTPEGLDTETAEVTAKDTKTKKKKAWISFTKQENRRSILQGRFRI